MSRERPFEVVMPIKVKTYDIDSAGHVSNIVYFRWLEDLRLQLMEEHFPLQTFMEMGLTPIIAASNIEYKKSIKLFDRPVGHMWIREIGKSSLKFQGEIYVANQLTTQAGHVGVFVDTKSGRPRRLPDIVVEKFHQESI
jgi:acyl-CoA thioester hydrolase